MKAVLGACVLPVALGTAGAIGQAVHSRTGLSGTARQALVAVICLAIAVSLVVVLRRRVDRRPLSRLGLANGATALRTFGLGLAVTAGSAAVLLGVGTWAGWLAWGPLDVPKLLGFLVVNALIAVALEAFPEELVFRGYVYTTLNQALRRWTAFLTTVLLFTFAGAGSSVVYAVVGTLLGEDVPAPGFAPAGEDPFAYAVLYPIFGSVLLIARITTGSLWTSVALHLTYLTVARVTLEGEARGAGWSMSLTTPDALVLMPGLLLLAALVFLLIARLRGRRLGWRERASE
ncbi:CPBP family glutamic-type intramembrane protease [Streptoalloteichus tenebrarius]|uniref:CPBP family glutamic-type intramembrane protease n=1 Tax=Streptoalloteichus tenebrarius (strain ATCC 17920 / DSM 40477 / JCM 4838 / CBS 697.72 / NBRC 16177 / NCIMB 11028 / NRRL B-12390 / A12253. 1 / ISP 5477) TaxID=1933 RepID=UPI0020A509A7|nr:CPBP family intramembrane glutamic endopeptidase [Streptoalloteichus tenebrarius]